MYYLINIYKSVSVKGPFANLRDAEVVLARINEGTDDGWVIVKTM